jgi:antitoxin ParD1/3/4
MNVSLTPEIEEFIKKKVESGLYVTASEVIRDAMRTYIDIDEIHQKHLQELRQKIQEGLDQLDRGEVIDGDEAFAQLHKMIEARKRKSA